ncbi:MAG: alpha-amylase family glycosyl hydrolase [Candidatus Korobacteraceae bacterium]
MKPSRPSHPTSEVQLSVHMTALFPTFEFHVSRDARDRYQFGEELFSVTGNVIFANLAASRQFAQRMNLVRDAAQHPELAVNPGELNAMALIDEVLHVVMALYRQQRDPHGLIEALAWFEARLGREALGRTLLAFADEFPTVAVYRGRQGAPEWLEESTGGVPNRAVALEELMMLWLANLNPAFRRFSELFADEDLAKSTAYKQLTAGLRAYFETRPRFGPENQNLVDLLRAPALASPDSLEGQIAFIRERWSPLLGDLVRRLLAALDVLKEEQTAIWLRFHPPTPHGGMGPRFGDSSTAAVPYFGGKEFEYERFSADVDWMPRTVMIAKSIYVWLDQLGKSYRRPIHTLDQVPDQELDIMARRGFNALWLIGVWERSRASQVIKRLTGNPEAAASAYSLDDYTIAQDLGGESAYVNLRDRAASRGIRLASDMVPNHMGIDSRWVIQHPDWFVQLPYPPFPAYSFEGPDLSTDGRVEIKIEDHYYDRSDAAVVFRRGDRWSGEKRYVYHGNDGTSFPWNDTAQLNYLKPEVREAVIQTILHVARLFPIIRFDAAMTLTKQHYQRLWFPVPGTGGAIPSRSEYGLTKQEFDAAMPVEFWRELVDRVAAEVPGTLLLAEAFWLLEGYFVRTLGMHRVYNSAFMNMLRDEENANYRSVIKNTLEFDPEVLKRYVNFMNNPDERTAVDQFGKGDKYFGVCTMMATLPGLPMFGHGQIEGFTERYGMEYRRAYHAELPDEWLVARHEREISPLLHRRALFADVKEFLLYDFYTDEGRVNEDVFAYSNRLGDQRTLVVYNNRYSDTRGWIRVSCACAEKNPDGSKRLRQRTLGEGFDLKNEASMFAACRDAVTGLEYLHHAGSMCEKGLRIELGAYQHHVFLDWRDLREDATHPWAELCEMLGGRGVASLDDALRDLRLKPVHDALRALLTPEAAEHLAAVAAGTSRNRDAKLVTPAQRLGTPARAVVARVEAEHLRALLEHVQALLGAEEYAHLRRVPVPDWRQHLDSVLESFERQLGAAVRIPELERQFTVSWPAAAKAVLPTRETPSETAIAIWGTVLAWSVMHAIGTFLRPADPNRGAARAFEALRLREPMAEAFRELGWHDEKRWQAAARVRASFAHAYADDGARSTPARANTARAGDPGVPAVSASEAVPATRKPTVPAAGGPISWLHDPDVAWLIGVHRYQDEQYFVKEPFERFLWWMTLPALLRMAEDSSTAKEAVGLLERQLERSLWAASEAGYRVEALLAMPGGSDK